MSVWTAESLYGATPQAPSYGVAAPTEQMGTNDITAGVKGLIDPNNPLMWFGVLLLITVGAAGVAGSVRLGRAKLGVELDRA